ncbi:MAG: ornithine--oxo-acid transaminase [Gammaproteobacteria bacterium]|nr:ornithine--oxo-acid transaminase [Gammaproteobacteria bacterium]
MDIPALEQRYCAHNYHSLPVVLTRALDVYAWDTQGRRYLDMMSAYSAVSHGHAHPRLLNALTTQAQRLAICSRAYYSDQLGPFAEHLCKVSGFDRVLPMNTGAEAVETALKAARKWGERVKGIRPDQTEIIACTGNFHGRTIAIVGLSSEPQYRAGFGPYPPGLKTVAYGDAHALEAAITPQTAAFLVEAIQGEGGIIIPPDGYLAACARICAAHRVLLIVDEIQTGLGRTGRWFASQHEGVQPDAMLLGKALGGGLLPVSAFLARNEVMDVFSPGDHGSTFGGNPLACAVGLEALKVLDEQQLIANAAQQGAYFIAQLQTLRHSAIRDVRGRGLLLGVEVDGARVSARALCEALLAEGVLSKDTHESVIRFAPPLTVKPEHIDTVVAAFAKVLNRY